MNMSTTETLAWTLGAAALAAHALSSCRRRPRHSARASSSGPRSFVPWAARAEGPSSFVPWAARAETGVLVVDAVRSGDGPQLTHTRGGRTPAHYRGDTSTACVLNAAEWKGLTESQGVTCNHWDIDGHFAVFAALAREEASKHGDLLRAAAHLGDFRERLDLDSATGRAALRLCCSLNALERDRFWRPFASASAAEGADDAAKYEYFLRETPRLLAEAQAWGEGRDGRAPWTDDTPGKSEYAAVSADWALACSPAVCVSQSNGGLAVIRSPRALHYYAAFSLTEGAEAVLTLLPGRRYELELKYTGFVDLASRPASPRIDLGPLACKLNELEGAPGFRWSASRITDSGPIMRLDPASGSRLSKAERYGSPSERPIYASTISPSSIERLTKSFFAFAASADGAAPRMQWTWAELHALNESIDWDRWAAPDVPKRLLSSAKGSAAAAEEIVVVLGCPIASPHLRERVAMGVEVWRGTGGGDAKLLLTGFASAPDSERTEARAMAAIAADLGVPKGAMILEECAEHTIGNALQTRHLLSARRREAGEEEKPRAHLTLVTSDWHLPRAYAAFCAVFGDDGTSSPAFVADGCGAPSSKAAREANREAERAGLGGLSQRLARIGIAAESLVVDHSTLDCWGSPHQF